MTAISYDPAALTNLYDDLNAATIPDDYIFANVDNALADLCAQLYHMLDRLERAVQSHQGALARARAVPESRALDFLCGEAQASRPGPAAYALARMTLELHRRATELQAFCNEYDRAARIIADNILVEHANISQSVGGNSLRKIVKPLAQTIAGDERFADPILKKADT